MPQTGSDFERSHVALRSFKVLLPGSVSGGAWKQLSSSMAEQKVLVGFGLSLVPCPWWLWAGEWWRWAVLFPWLSYSPSWGSGWWRWPAEPPLVCSAAKGVLKLFVFIEPLFPSFHHLNGAERGFAGRLFVCHGNCVRCFGSIDYLTFPVRQGNSQWSSQNSSLCSSCGVLIAWQTKHSSCFGSSLFV